MDMTTGVLSYHVEADAGARHRRLALGAGLIPLAGALELVANVVAMRIVVHYPLSFYCWALGDVAATGLIVAGVWLLPVVGPKRWFPVRTLCVVLLVVVVGHNALGFADLKGVALGGPWSTIRTGGYAVRFLLESLRLAAAVVYLLRLGRVRRQRPLFTVAAFALLPAMLFTVSVVVLHVSNLLWQMNPALGLDAVNRWFSAYGQLWLYASFGLVTLAFGAVSLFGMLGMQAVRRGARY